MDARRTIRVAALLVGIAAAVIALGFQLGWPLSTDMWPFSVTQITYTFLASYAAGSVATLIWIASTGEMGGLAPFGVTTAVAYGTLSVALLDLLGRDDAVMTKLVVAVLLCAAGIATIGIGLRQPTRDERITPRWLRAACLIVTVLLLMLAVPLVMRIPDVMPWDLDVDSGALIGCLFLGSAAYFALGAIRPGWPMAAGPLAALLAYDLVLTLPLIAHVQVARPQHMTVLVVYIAVLVSSTILGVYVFLIDRRTRWGTTSPPVSPSG